MNIEIWRIKSDVYVVSFSNNVSLNFDSGFYSEILLASKFLASKFNSHSRTEFKLHLFYWFIFLLPLCFSLKWSSTRNRIVVAARLHSWVTDRCRHVSDTHSLTHSSLEVMNRTHLHESLSLNNKQSSECQRCAADVPDVTVIKAKPANYTVEFLLHHFGCRAYLWLSGILIGDLYCLSCHEFESRAWNQLIKVTEWLSNKKSDDLWLKLLSRSSRFTSVYISGDTPCLFIPALLPLVTINYQAPDSGR